MPIDHESHAVESCNDDPVHAVAGRCICLAAALACRHVAPQASHYSEKVGRSPGISSSEVQAS
jgi:hypothetical protein